jgi:hypothetical protein
MTGVAARISRPGRGRKARVLPELPPDALFDAPGDPKRLNLSAAMHGFHANYLTGRGEEACAMCHPDSPTGATRCQRDNHAQKGIGCSDATAIWKTTP